MEWLRILMVSTSLVSVTDGDTLRLPDGQGVRLTGFNTPEIFSPKCPAEKDLGLRAKERLRALIRAGNTRLAIGPGTCAYGRLCGTLTVNGELVSEVLIREGLAEPMLCTEGRCPKPRDWCKP